MGLLSLTLLLGLYTNTEIATTFIINKRELKEIQGKKVEKRLKKRRSNDQPKLGSISWGWEGNQGLNVLMMLRCPYRLDPGMTVL